MSPCRHSRPPPVRHVLLLINVTKPIGVIIQALKDDGATMLMVEQNLALAFKVADRFIILRDGTVSDGGFVKSLEGDHDDIVRTIYL